MYNEKLLQAALKYEAQRASSIDTICRCLYELNLIDEPKPFLANSAAMNFTESGATEKQMLFVLNALGYKLEPKTRR